MDKMYCDLCKQDFDSQQYDVHIKSHLSTGPIPAPATHTLPLSDNDFIPEIEKDEYGKRKPTQYKQKPYIPLSDFEG